jgi:NAD+ synthase
MTLQKQIADWIKDYATHNTRQSLVVGISGGIDSSVVSTLCAMTELPVYAVSMPIKQIQSQHNLSIKHGEWLTNKFSNVEHIITDLDTTYNAFKIEMQIDFNNQHAFANTKSRIRMVALHHIAGATQGLVVGTGNKVEDFGVGFYTKYGDGGVDISPIADLMKSEVWQLGKDLNVLQEIIDAPPTDGLWEDGRTDKDQLGGLTYEDMERAMMLDEISEDVNSKQLSDNEINLLHKYHSIRKPNLHKMNPIPIFKK